MDVTVSIVTYNSADCIVGCVESVLAQIDVAVEIVVIDNASRDATLEKLKPFQPRVKVVANPDNVGFGRAHNQALRAAQGSFYFVLNPDAWLGRPDTLKTLMAEMASHPAWGLATPAIEGMEGLPYQNSYPGQKHLSQALPAMPGDIAWVLGASMFVRKCAFEQVQGFDEQFFLYSEETDLCFRLRSAGFELGYAPEVRVGHRGGDSEKSSPPYEVWKRKQAGVFRFFEKHYSLRDTRRLLNRDLRLARFRLAMLWLTGAGRRKAAKVAKYRAMRDSVLEYRRSPR
jgi:GT2 family glycosyltransferase